MTRCNAMVDTSIRLHSFCYTHLPLSHIESIDLGNNEFTGSIPAEVGQWNRLEYLSVNNNNLQGQIPMNIGMLTSLKTLKVNSNMLTGVVPASISNMINLKSLQLYENDLSGVFPESVLQLQNLGKDSKTNICVFLSFEQKSCNSNTLLHSMKSITQKFYL